MELNYLAYLQIFLRILNIKVGKKLGVSRQGQGLSHRIILTEVLLLNRIVLMMPHELCGDVVWVGIGLDAE